MRISYSKKMYLKANLKFLLVFVLFIIILFLNYRYGISKANFTFTTFVLLFAVLIGFILYPLVMLMRNKLDKFEDGILDEANSARLGFEGENTVASWLEEILPKTGYIVLPNVILPKHRFDIDFVVIGPKGVVVLEVKNRTGKYHFSNDEYFEIKNSKENILPPSFDPREQISKHSYYLRKYFEFNGYDNIRILKAVVLINKDLNTIDGSTNIYIANGYDSLKRFLDNTSSDVNYTPEFCEKLKQVLLK